MGGDPNRSSNKESLLLESVLATVLVFIVMWLLFFLFTWTVKPLNYLAKTVKEIHYTDLYFSQLNNASVDTSIILVNAGDLDRAQLASLIQKIAEIQPASIGLDILFDGNRAETGDDLLKQILVKYQDKIILACSDYLDANLYQTIPELQFARIDFGTSIDQSKTIRQFSTKNNSNVNNCTDVFSAKLVAVARPDAYEIFKKRERELEWINYVGNKDMFAHIEGAQILQDSSLAVPLKDKIVIIGFLGIIDTERPGIVFHDLDDLFHTPLAFNSGKSKAPDMYGSIIHANIAHMILNQNYINQPPSIFLWLIVVLGVWLHVLPFSYFYVKRHLYYHIFAKIFQLLTIALLFLLSFWLLDSFQILLDTKYLLLGVFLAVDVLYLYEALSVFIYKKTKWKSYFIHEH